MDMAAQRTEVKPARVADRLFARLIDGVVLVVPTVLLFGAVADARRGWTALDALAVVGLGLVDAAYEIALTAIRRPRDCSPRYGGDLSGKCQSPSRVPTIHSRGRSWSKATSARMGAHRSSTVHGHVKVPAYGQPKSPPQ